ncbi:MAG: aspartate dehydrogenase [Clostridia bacterium]|nr:aspartate dehydrogenase [Clostridia bacterium]
MALFRKKASPPDISFDPATQEPAVRKSICTGEMTVGFLDKTTGAFHEWMLVDQAGLDAFRKRTGAQEIKTIY